MSNRLLRVFLDVDMRNGHVGLKKLSESNGYDVEQLNVGQHVVFINKRSNKIKIFSKNNVVSYMMSKTRFELGSLNYFSEAYGADGFSYDKALKKVLSEKLK